MLNLILKKSAQRLKKIKKVHLKVIVIIARVIQITIIKIKNKKIILNKKLKKIKLKTK